MFLHKQEFTPELLARMVEAVLQQTRVRRHLAALQSRVPSRDTMGLAGKNPAVRRAVENIQRAADDPECTVLVAGERGTGHELAAQAIHARSRTRSDAPLVMASGLSTRAEDAQMALFGGPRWSGMPRRKGLLEQANRGVLFFDRIEALDAGVRATLSKVLRKRLLNLDPTDVPIPLDMQLVAGTGPDGIGVVAGELQGIAIGERLVEIYLPPLRERREDIPLLAAYFLQELRQAGRTSARTLSRDALAALEAHTWPNNLLELQNTLEFAAIQALVDSSEEIAQEYLPAFPLKDADSNRVGGGWDYRYHLARTEVALVQRALQERAAVNKTQLAEKLRYTDRFAFGRRMRKALGEFPDIAHDFPQVSRLFRIVD
jgi:DNA-binding NtrC family response regulator